eukprot:214855_1
MSVFIEYLCECFALENMLFLERAIILHHLIKKYQDMDTAHAVPPVDADEKLKFDTVCARPYYKLQFMHLTPIYNDIEAIIKKGCEENEESDTMVYKRGIVSA